MLCFLGEQMGVAIAYSTLAEHNVKLKREASLVRQQLEERKIIERAKGVLQQRFGLSEEEAYRRLRDESRRLRRSMRDVAEAVLLVENIGQEAGSVRAITNLANQGRAGHLHLSFG